MTIVEKEKKITKIKFPGFATHTILTMIFKKLQSTTSLWIYVEAAWALHDNHWKKIFAGQKIW